MRNNPFKGKVALVTGSSRGIGMATAREMGRRGAKVALNARGEERLEKAKAELESSGIETAIVASDVTTIEGCRDMVERTVSELGGLDILVNNAGMSMRSNLEELEPETCRKMVDLNLMGCIYATQFAIPHIKKNGGSILYISSIGGLIGLPTASIYCATKTALRGLADSLRCELAEDGVHVGVVYVGFTQNDPDKTVAGPAGKQVPHDRPAHMTWEQVGHEVCSVVKHRRRHNVLTPAGKLANFTAWLSPRTVEQAIILSRRFKLSEMLGMR